MFQRFACSRVKNDKIITKSVLTKKKAVATQTVALLC